MDPTQILQSATTFLQIYGYWIFAAVGFAEFAGLPLASSAVLVAGGSLAAGGGISYPAVVLAAAAGALLADLGWYGLARWQGRRAVDLACGLTSHPNACVLGVHRQIQTVGVPYLLVAKFLPGTANLVAPAAGLARLPVGSFVPGVGIALTGWAALYTGIGWIFREQVEAVLSAMFDYLPRAAAVALVLVVVAVVWRWHRVRHHRTAHGDAGSGGEGPSDRDPDGDATEARGADRSGTDAG